MNPQLLARKQQLANDPKSRLRWRILWAFGALPSEERAEMLGDDQVIDCALHMILDRGDRPSAVENPNFSMETFLARQEEQGHGIK